MSVMLEGTANLKPINIPVCKICKKEHSLKLTTLDEKTQLGFAEYKPTCNCPNKCGDVNEF